MDFNELLLLAQTYLRKMHRYWIAGLVAAWLVTITGCYYVLRLPDSFEASARIFVDTENVLRPLLKGLSVEEDVMNDVAIMTRAVKSRPNLEKVARDADLDLQAKTQNQFEALIGSLDERISIVGDRQQVYTLLFTDRDRSKAVEVVRLLVNTFVEDVLNSNADDSDQAETAIKVELDDYERRLKESEQRLKAFKQENVGLMPGERGDYYARLQAAREEAKSVEVQLRLVEGRKSALARQIEGEEPVFGMVSLSSSGEQLGGPSTQYDGEIETLRQQRSQLLISFTEKHPDVVRIENRLKTLNELRDAAIAEAPPMSPRDISPVTSDLDMNPVYQSLRIQLNDTEVEVETLRNELVTRQLVVEELEKLVNVVPEVEARLTQLNRDYDVILQRYQALLVRWENLQTSKRVGDASGKVSFRIIDPPFVPQEPSGPPRGLLLMMVTAAAIGSGVGITLLLVLLRPVYSDIREFTFPNITPIGAISFSNKASTYSSHFATLIMGTGLLLASICAIILTMDFWVSILSSF